MGVYKVNIISVCCVATMEGKAIAPRAGVFRTELIPSLGEVRD